MRVFVCVCVRVCVCVCLCRRHLTQPRAYLGDALHPYAEGHGGVDKVRGVGREQRQRVRVLVEEEKILAQQRVGGHERVLEANAALSGKRKEDEEERRRGRKKKKKRE